MIKLMAFGVATILFAYTFFQISSVNHQIQEMQLAQQQINELVSTSAKEKKVVEPLQSPNLKVQIDEIHQQTNDVTQQIASLESQIANLSETVAQIAETASNNQITQSQAYQVDEPDINSSEDSSATESNNSDQSKLRVQMLESMISDPAQADDQWSNTTQTAIENIISNTPDLDIANVSNAQCGGTLCKVQLTLPANLDELQKNTFSWTLLMKVLGEEIPNGTYFVNENYDGSQQLTYYLVRNGHQLPQLE